MIVGAGFGGINAVIRQKKADVDVTVIDRRNPGHTGSHVRIAAKPLSGAIFA